MQLRSVQPSSDEVWCPFGPPLEIQGFTNRKNSFPFQIGSVTRLGDPLLSSARCLRSYARGRGQLGAVAPPRPGVTRADRALVGIVTTWSRRPS